MTQDFFGSLGRDFFDVDPTGRTRHENSSFRRAIDDDADVCLARNLRRGGDENFLNGQAFDRKLEDLGSDRFRLLRSFCELDPARFAAPTGVDLRLDDDRRVELPRDFLCLFRRRRNLSGRNRNAVLAENLLRLVLVDVHSFSKCVRCTRINRIELR